MLNPGAFGSGWPLNLEEPVQSGFGLHGAHWGLAAEGQSAIKSTPPPPLCFYGWGVGGVCVELACLWL